MRQASLELNVAEVSSPRGNSGKPKTCLLLQCFYCCSIKQCNTPFHLLLHHELCYAEVCGLFCNLLCCRNALTDHAVHRCCVCSHVSLCYVICVVVCSVVSRCAVSPCGCVTLCCAVSCCRLLCKGVVLCSVRLCCIKQICDMSTASKAAASIMYAFHLTLTPVFLQR